MRVESERGAAVLPGCRGACYRRCSDQHGSQPSGIRPGAESWRRRQPLSARVPPCRLERNRDRRGSGMGMDSLQAEVLAVAERQADVPDDELLELLEYEWER